MTTVNKLMIGIAAGAILGVLYAPDKGSVTRRKLNRIGNDLSDRFHEIKDSIQDKLDDLKDDASDKAYQEIVIVEEPVPVVSSTWQS